MDDQIRIDQRIYQHALKLEDALSKHMHDSFMPDAKKELRNFSSAEVADLLGISPSHLRNHHAKDKLPDLPADHQGRRRYSADYILEARKILAQDARNPLNFLPGRKAGDRMLLISCANFKGGAGKTTTTINLGQRLALRGYRVLVIDMDPQASLTSMFGYQPEIEFGAKGTVYDAIKYDAPVPIKTVIRKTYFPNLDLCPAALILSEFETETARALFQDIQPPFYRRLDAALESVQDDYDVVLIDCPPQLGFLTLSALIASTGILITVTPSMMDVASMAHFLTMAASLLETVGEHGADLNYDFMRFVVTRFEPNDGPQAQMAGFLRGLFGSEVMTNQFLKSTAVSDAGITQQTIYEVDRSLFNKNTLDRALESFNGVADELEALLQKSWGRV